MPQLQTLSAERLLLLEVTGVALILLSHVFNGFIDMQADIDPDGPGSEMYVVMGVGYTLIGATGALTILYGFEWTLWVMCVIAACFMVAGIPLIFGALRRTALRRKRKADEEQKKKIEEELKEYIGGNGS